MNYSNLLKISGSALLRNKMRSLLTMLGIIIGVASVIAMLGIGQGSKQSIRDTMSSMGTNLVFVMPGSQQRGGVQMGPSNAKSLNIEDVVAIQNNAEHVAMVSPEVRTSGQVVVANKNWPSTAYGGNEQYLDIKKYTVESGRNFTLAEVRSMAKVCLVGQTIIENLFEKGADPIGQTIRFGKVPLKIIGVLADKGENSFGQDQDDAVIAPYSTVQRRIMAVDHIQSIQTSATSEEESPLAIAEIQSILRKQHKITNPDDDDFRVMSQAELVKTFSSISDILTTLLGAIAGISLLVGGIGIMNIMYVSVTERTREIGLRMAIGGKGKHILLQFLVESMLLSIAGGVIGILLGYLASSVVSGIMGWPVAVSTQSVVMAFAVCTAIGVFFGWYPARKASNLNPIEALRYE
jgi:putative ABC transport system permease protein